ncbi:MAG: hypothetical protein IKV35_04740 [Clostridia bacterium]|nr:hypothetical protein [Clostridia bacterium]
MWLRIRQDGAPVIGDHLTPHWICDKSVFSQGGKAVGNIAAQHDRDLCS